MMDFTNGKIQFKLLSVFAPNFSKPKSSMSAINKCAQTIKQTIIGKGILGELFPIYYDFCGLPLQTKLATERKKERSEVRQKSAQRQYFKELCKNPFPSAFQFHYQEDPQRMRIMLYCKNSPQIAKASEAVYKPWNRNGDQEGSQESSGRFIWYLQKAVIRFTGWCF